MGRFHLDEVAALQGAEGSQGQQSLTPQQFEDLKILLSHRVKLRMTLNIRGKVSSVVPSHHHHLSSQSATPVPNTPKEESGSGSAVSAKTRSISVFTFKQEDREMPESDDEKIGGFNLSHGWHLAVKARKMDCIGSVCRSTAAYDHSGVQGSDEDFERCSFGGAGKQQQGEKH